MTLETDAEEARKEVWKTLRLESDLYHSSDKYCNHGAIEMNERGYQIVVGSVEVDNYYGVCGPDVVPMHYWVYDPASKRHCDITASQLNIHLSPGKKFPDIFIWNDGEKTIYVEERRGLKPEEVFGWLSRKRNKLSY